MRDQKSKTRHTIPHLEVIADVIPDAVISINDKGTIIFWNPAAEMIFGYAKDEILGKNVTTIMPKKYIDAYKEGLKNYLKTGKRNIIGQTVELSGLKKNGEEFPIELSLYYWTENNETLFTCTIHDITSHHQILADTKMINKLSAKISESLEVDEILETSLTEVLKALKVKHGCIYEIEPSGKLVMKVQKGLNDDFLEEKKEVLLGDGCAGEAAVNQTFFAPSERERNFVCADTERLLGLDCLAAIPIVSKGVTRGVMEFFAPVHRRLSERERWIVKSVTNQLATVLENAYLYWSQKNTANVLQEALLKVPKEISGLDFEHLYYSSVSEPAQAGGDFYDIFELDLNNVGILIGDVSGKGIKAATITSLVKHTIKAYIFQKTEPCEALTMANNVIIKETDPIIFISVFIGVLNTISGRLTYCNAGHPPPILKKGKSSTLLHPQDPVLGVIADHKYINNEVKLGSKDILVLYTDGITEARRNGDFYGEKRLVNFVNTVKNEKRIPNKILNEINTFSEGNLADDVAILTLKIHKKY